MENREIIQRSIDYIEENLQTTITAEELADQAGFSLFHYYRLFQAEVGMTVAQYILRRRLLHGIYSIARGKTMVDAALQYGFDTYAGFYRAFCREFGCTPSDYLRSGRTRRPYRIDLAKEEHLFVTHKKAAKILKNWNLEDSVITDIYYDGTGRKNESACYVGDEFVLKYTADLEKLKKHIAVSETVENVGLGSAVPVKTADGRQFVEDGELYYFLTRRLPGRQMLSVDFYDGNYVCNARFVGEIIGQLHLVLRKNEDCGNEEDLLGKVRDWALPQAKKILKLSDGFCKEYLQKFGAIYCKLPRQMIHRDPNPGNIICAEDMWGFIDFDLAERNIRIYDPCYAATAVLSENFGEHNGNWLEVYRNIVYGYDSVVQLTVDEYEAIPYVILANQFVCVAWFAEYEKYSELYDKNVQMTRWLMDNMEELKKL